MKLKIWARVGCTFNIECDPTVEAITQALKNEVAKIPFAEGETYVPWDGPDVTVICDTDGNPVNVSGIDKTEIMFAAPVLPSPVSGLPSPAPVYVLFAPEDIINIFTNDGLEGLIEHYHDEGDYLNMETREFLPGTPVTEVMVAMEPFGGYAILTQEEYNDLQDL